MNVAAFHLREPATFASLISHTANRIESLLCDLPTLFPRPGSTTVAMGGVFILQFLTNRILAFVPASTRTRSTAARARHTIA